jgi:hypothetical protein
MPILLDTILKKDDSMSNRVNSDLLKNFYQHMKDNGTSENYQKASLKAIVHFADRLSSEGSFYDVIVKKRLSCSHYQHIAMVVQLPFKTLLLDHTSLR